MKAIGSITKTAQVLFIILLHVRLNSMWAEAVDSELPRPSSEQIVIADTVGNEKVIRQAAFVFGSAEPQLKISIIQMTIEDAVAAVAQKEADLLVFAWPLPEDCRHRLAATFLKYAADPVLFLVNAANPLSGLKSAELLDVFSGQISFWEPLNGLGYMIHLAGVAPDIPGQRAFAREIMGERKTTEHVYRATSSREVMILAGGNRHLLGYCGAIKLEDDKVKALDVDNVAPTAENILSGKYRPCVFYAVAVSSSSTGAPSRFAQFLTSDTCAEIVENAGFVPFRQPAATRE